MTAYQLNETLLAVNALRVDIADRTILRDVTFSIRNITRPDTLTGQVVAVVGPSGIGKTTLLRCIAGLDEPTSGFIAIEGAETLRRGVVGYVFQQSTLFAHRTVLWNLMIAGKGTHAQKRTRAMELIASFGIADRANRYPAELSGGERQRVAILQQVLCSRHFLLMDEPVSGLDPIATARVLSLIRELASRDDLNTIIFSTHNIDAALSVADTILLMGREEDGGTIRRTYDLIEAGLAWREDGERTPQFAQLRREIIDEMRRAA